MISAVSDATQTQPVAPSTASSSQKPAQSQPQSATTDSVQLSAAAQAALAAIQEARETQAQTSKEAAGGDQQAMRLLAKEAAAKPAAE
jgi:hypothetical protein